MNSRVKITIGDASVEIEGSEEHVDKKLKDVSVLEALIAKVGTLTTKKPPIKAIAKPRTPSQREKTAKPRKLTLEVDKGLNLEAEGEILALADFYKQKEPKSNYERNAVYIYYLEKLKEISNVKVNYVYTCYKKMGAKVGHLGQSLIDTASKGLIIASDKEDLHMTVKGVEFVDHELPKKKKE